MPMFFVVIVAPVRWVANKPRKSNKEKKRKVVIETPPPQTGKSTTVEKRKTKGRQLIDAYEATVLKSWIPQNYKIVRNDPF